MLKRYSFWLPALYLGFLCLTFIDMALGITGSGEANFGAWMFYFSFLPFGALANALGSNTYFMESKSLMAMIVLLQALFLLVLGAAIDSLFSRLGPTPDEGA
jgi:hypothetical protein